jgi:NTE family protein
MAKRTGLVLTGGGLRGICAQAGALVALERQGYRFDAVIGTSAGAIVGALYASYGPGNAESEVLKRLRTIRREDYIDERPSFELAVLALNRLERVTGYNRGEALLTWLKDNLGKKNIEECDPPLMLTVTNVSRTIPQVKESGPLAEFARASSAIPVVYELQQVDGEFYADGGAVNNVPVDELAARRPDLEQFLVLSSLSIEPEIQSVDNSFFERDFAPVRSLERILRAIAEAQALENLEAGDRAVIPFRVTAPDLDLEEADRVSECLDAAIANAESQMAAGGIDLSHIPKG